MINNMKGKLYRPLYTLLKTIEKYSKYFKSCTKLIQKLESIIVLLYSHNCLAKNKFVKRKNTTSFRQFVQLYFYGTTLDAWNPRKLGFIKRIIDIIDTPMTRRVLH